MLKSLWYQHGPMLKLIPTPINETLSLDGNALRDIEKTFENFKIPNEFSTTGNTGFGEVVVLVESAKVARRRWLAWGLKREFISSFVEFHEQNFKEVSFEILKALKRKEVFRVYLMSDGGLPAFCDPGAFLVDLLHENKIPVTSCSFENAPLLALCLSGLNVESDEFHFAGFLPHKNEELRVKKLREHISRNEIVILMDTPYRLKKMLGEIQGQLKLADQLNRKIFLAMNLNMDDEELWRGKISQIIELFDEASLREGQNIKKEFILILGPRSRDLGS
jgi:16S rRNA (cytidine1402-2'-O)-methyltransferase